jgi:hypothetical protein
MGTLLALAVVVVAMLVSLAAAGCVVAYVAFVSRGRPVPHAPWLGDMLGRLVRRWGVPTEPAEPDDPHDPHQRLHLRRGGIHRASRH